MNLSKELGKGTYRKTCRKFKDFAKVENRVEKIMWKFRSLVWKKNFKIE